ncbi:hypothetical protein [Mesorhizobium sp. M4B.F.Ca.ET.143.01.1.1]|uniref:hypothetical protein n=1 Tax=Mesorhizobium sp. M4B.F.Ca.ET.143.01.1.1 TaxID=2563947 RepID=UPI001093F897|nr:hypothetical protein [Mesorhizobium sp. M4B.F.Ca.ET.143.01.1.1]TGV26370.1 hypothetical protein EN786_12680 [Mesorhizobium sp. M4B.F.Ca.ET.143.01.1.1]
MNTYSHQFYARCPGSGDTIEYSLKLETGRTVMVEDIEKECSFPEPAYHEDIANKLAKIFGGRQTISAYHGCIHIETVRVRA